MKVGISLIISTFLITGCYSKQLHTQHNEELVQPKTPSAKKVFVKNSEIATQIAQIEAKISRIDNEISHTAFGKARVKLIETKKELDEEVRTLRDQQISNVKRFKISKQQEQKARS